MRRLRPWLDSHGAGKSNVAFVTPCRYNGSGFDGAGSVGGIRLDVLRGSWMDKEGVAAVIEEIRPMLQADGGDIELVDVEPEEGVVKVRLTGACGGCPMAQMTLQMGVQRKLKEAYPELKEVVSV